MYLPMDVCCEAEMINKQREMAALPAAPNPGNFPIRSTESRAAARMLAERKSKPKRVIQVVFVSPDGTREGGPRIELDE